MGNKCPALVRVEPAKTEIGDLEDAPVAFLGFVDKEQKVLRLDIAVSTIANSLGGHISVGVSTRLRCREVMDPLECTSNALALAKHPLETRLVEGWRWLLLSVLPQCLEIALGPMKHETVVVSLFVGCKQRNKMFVFISAQLPQDFHLCLKILLVVYSRCESVMLNH